MNKRPLKILLTFISIISVVIGGIFLFIKFLIGPTYYIEDLVENYTKRRVEIIEAKVFFESILPSGAIVNLEYDYFNRLKYFHVKIDGEFQSNWNLGIKSDKVDSLLIELNWTKHELKTLKDKLDKANCISITSSKPITIGWRRSGMGKFSYKLFDEPLNESQMQQYNDSCYYIYYKDNVVLEYGGGAIGPQCFSDLPSKQNE